MAAVRDRRRRPVRLASSVAVLVSAGLALSSCQSLFEQAYEPSVAPSRNPQIVDEVQKGDPRAQMGAREHPRIVNEIDDRRACRQHVPVRGRLEERLEDDHLLGPLDTHGGAIHAPVHAECRHDAFDDHLVDGRGGSSRRSTACGFRQP